MKNAKLLRKLYKRNKCVGALKGLKKKFLAIEIKT